MTCCGRGGRVVRPGMLMVLSSLSAGQAAGPAGRLAMIVHTGGRMLQLDPDAFEALVTEVLDALPDEMVEGLDNVVFLVEDEHPEEDLLGIYEGVAITDRGQYGFGELPDRIMVYRLPHLETAETIDELRAEVRTTIVHEIAHFYGIDDEQLHELGWA